MEKKYQVVDELYEDIDKKYEKNIDSILIKLFIFWLIIAVLLIVLQDVFVYFFPKVSLIQSNHARGVSRRVGIVNKLAAFLYSSVKNKVLSLYNSY